jgi:hypothetical protein
MLWVFLFYLRFRKMIDRMQAFVYGEKCNGCFDICFYGDHNDCAAQIVWNIVCTFDPLSFCLTSYFYSQNENN